MISLAYLKVNLPLNTIFFINIQYLIGYLKLNFIQFDEIAVAPMVVCHRKSDGLAVGYPTTFS